MNDRSTLLLEHHLKELKLPSFLREYGKMAAQCAAEGVDHPQYLLRLAELELIGRHQAWWSGGSAPPASPLNVVSQWLGHATPEVTLASTCPSWAAPTPWRTCRRTGFKLSLVSAQKLNYRKDVHNGPRAVILVMSNFLSL